MEGDGGAASEAPVTTDSEQQENVTQVGATIPTITSTVSGLPISPAYAGYGFSTNVFASRKGHFSRGYAGAKPRMPKVSYESNYVPSRRGSQAVVHAERELIGDGERHVDPMDNFKPQKFKEGSTRTDDKPEQVDKEYRGAGKRAYKAENTGNSEGSGRRQARYTN
jgi:hypothetical protein